MVFSNEMTAGIVGAIVGAAVAHAIDAARERRRMLRGAQNATLGELLLLAGQFKAELLELAGASPIGRNHLSPDARRNLVELTKLNGRAAQLGMGLWQAYSSRRVRAALHKLRSRWSVTQDLILSGEGSARDRVLAFEWIDNQTNKFMEHCADDAGMSRTDHGGWLERLSGVTYVGFGKRARQRYEDIRFEDRSPPWKPDVDLRLSDLDIGTPDGDEFHAWTLARLHDVRCVNHGNAPHVTISGTTDSLKVEVQACCQELVRIALARLPGLEKLKTGR